MTCKWKSQTSIFFRLVTFNFLIYVLTLNIFVSSIPLFDLSANSGYETGSSNVVFSDFLENIDRNKLKKLAKKSFSGRLTQKREDEFGANIDELIKEKLMERLKSLYVVTTRSR